jgi:hypothetical protein
MLKNIDYLDAKPFAMSLFSFSLLFILSYFFHDCSTEMSLLVSSGFAILTMAHFGNKPLFDVPIMFYAILIVTLSMSINTNEIKPLQVEKITDTNKAEETMESL